MPSESREAVEARHRKELKAWDGEKRSALKKVKGTAGKGKKAKDLQVDVENEYEAKLKEIEARHAVELQECDDNAVSDVHDKPEPTAELTTPPVLGLVAAPSGTEQLNGSVSANDNLVDEEDEERRKRMEKARKKREKAREKERQREQQIAKETAEAGPSARDVENARIMQQLMPHHLTMKEVSADGHCLYRAVAAQCHEPTANYQDIRNLCADVLTQNEHDFSPFCEYTDDMPDFPSYVNRVRSSAEWGGHLELRALSVGLKRPIWIYSAQSKDPMIIEEQGNSSSVDPIRLSYHLHYYSLGEHYNQVVPREG